MLQCSISKFAIADELAHPRTGISSGQVRQGKIKRLIINMPPGSFKSLMTSICWPAFVLGHDPTKSIAVINYGADLATIQGNIFRQIVNSREYQAQFPLMRISAKNTELEFRTMQNGFRLGTTIEGAVTGFHTDILIVDGDTNDWSVATTWLYHERKYYLLDEFRDRLLYPLLRDRAIGYGRSSRANIVLLEDDILGRALAAEMKSAGFSVELVAPQQSKIMRMQVQSTKFRDGRVLFPNGASFLPEFEAELLAFPRGRFDDRVDSVALALSYEPPDYDLGKLADGFERFANELFWAQRFWSRIS